MVSLDVGCGNHKRGDIGVDYSREAKPNIVADGHFLPFKDCVFDNVISFTVLEHSPNPLIFLKEQFRVLKKHGFIECTTDNAQFYRWSVLGIHGSQHERWWDDHYMVFYPNNVKRLMELAGFSHTYYGFLNVHLKQVERFLLFWLIKLGFFRVESAYARFRVVGYKF